MGFHFRQHRRDVVKTVKGFLFEPSRAFDRERKTSLADATTYFLSMLFFESVLSSVALLAVLPGARTFALGWLVLTLSLFVLMAAVKVIWAAWLHLWIVLLTKGKNLEQTMKVVFFAKTPFYVFGWIPVIGFLAVIWELILTAIGISRIHKVDQGSAALSLVVALVIPMIIVILFFLAVAFWFLTAFPLFGGHMMWARQ